jgi:hypothetical protein
VWLHAIHLIIYLSILFNKTNVIIFKLLQYLTMDTSGCEPIKIEYEKCLKTKLENFGDQKPDIDCVPLFEVSQNNRVIKLCFMYYLCKC